MIVTRFSDAEPYAASNHAGMVALRLQKPAGAFASIGLSHYLPGGVADMSSSPVPKFYVVVAGEVTVTIADGSTTTLRHLDSCYLAPNEVRSVTNRSNCVASMLVMMAQMNA